MAHQWMIGHVDNPVSCSAPVWVITALARRIGESGLVRSGRLLPVVALQAMLRMLAVIAMLVVLAMVAMLVASARPFGDGYFEAGVSLFAMHGC